MAVVLAAAAAGPHSVASLREGCEQPRGGRTWSPLIDRAFALSKWREADPVTPRQARRIETHRHCARSEETRAWMVRSNRRHRQRFKAYRERRLDARAERRALTPYDCGSAGRFAIPCYIVACESGYSWSAYNPSGAAGPYQIMGEHGRPWPVDSAEDKLTHHRIASRLWNGGAGASNWVCA